MKPLVLISGGAGFIGSHTADLLLKKGYRVRILDNLSSKTHNGHWPKYLDERVEKVKGDVRNKKDWERALKGVDYVIHLAAWMDLMPEFSKFFSINVVGTANLYEVIVNEKLPIKKVIVASSQFVYGQGRWRCKKDGVVFPKDREDTNLQKGIWDPVCPKCGGKITPLKNTEDHQNPPNQYAISKYTQELIAMKLGKLYGIPSTVLRYSIVHGPRQSVKNLYSGALRNFVLQILMQREPVIFEDGNQLRDYISVEDTARANVLVMENTGSNYQVYNVGSGRKYTVKDLVEIIAKVLNKKVTVEPSGSYRVGDIRHAVSDIRKMMKLGWRPKVTEEKAVLDFFDYIKKNQPRFLNERLIDKALERMYKKGIIKNIKNAYLGNNSHQK